MHDSQEPPPQARRALLCAWLLIPLCLPACSSPEPQAVAASPGSDASDDVAPAPSCHAVRRQPDGLCCTVGTFYDASTASCRGAGPMACRMGSIHEPDACAPRWCFDWLDAKGAPCVAGGGGCQPRVRPCTQQEFDTGGGCQAGHWPAAADPPCRPAALALETTAIVDEDTGLGGARPPAGTPPIAALPELLATGFCADPDGTPRLCAADEEGCGAGKMADPDAPGSCTLVGVPWLCPPGFVPADAPPVADTLTPCVADPADCGTDPFGGVAEGKDVLFVDGAAPAGGVGTRASPLNDLAAAVAQCPAQGTVAIAAGLYSGALKLTSPCNLMGRCAAKVTLTAPGGTVLLAWKGGVTGWMTLRGLRITGEGWGLNIKESFQVRGERLWIDGPRGRGVAAMAGHLQLVQSVIGDVRPAADGSLGIGAGAGWGGTLELEQVRISHSRATGVLVQGGGATAAARQVLIDGTGYGSLSTSHGVGLMVTGGAAASLRGARLSGNRLVGAIAAGAGSSVDAAGALVAFTWPAADGGAGHAAAAIDGGALKLRGVRLHRSHTSAMQIEGQGSSLDAHGLIIDHTDTDPKTAASGAGLVVANAKATLHSVRVADSRVVGVGVTGGSAMISGLLVERTRARQTDGELGVGLSVEGSATVVLQGAHIRHSSHAGVNVAQAGSNLSATALLVAEGAPLTGEKGRGLGLAMGPGTTVNLRGARLHHNSHTGLVVSGMTQMARLRLHDSLIDQTRHVGAEQSWGSGMIVEGFVNVEIVGSRLVANHFAGLGAQKQKGAADPGGPLLLRAHGLWIHGTRGHPAHETNGMGAVMVLGADDVVFDSCLFSRNRSAAVGISGASASLRDCVIIDTLASKYPHVDGRVGRGLADTELADGLMAHQAAKVEVLRCLITRSRRAGLLLEDNKSVVLRQSVIAGGHFGIAAEGNQGYEATDNLLFDNQSNLAGDFELAVPPPVVLEGL